MRTRVRASLVAATLVAATYCVITAANHLATAATTGGDTAGAAVKASALADPATSLPGGSAGDVVVDETHGKVFISRPNIGSVVVTDLDGQVVQTLEGFTYPTEMAISPDGGTVYVTEYQAHRYGQINTSDLAVTHASIPETDCAVSVAFTGGKPFYVYDKCDGNALTGGIGVIDPATSTGASVLSTRPGHISALPNRPDRAVVMDESGQIAVYDLSAAPPTTVATLDPGGTGRGACRDGAFLASGDQVVTACGSTPVHEVFTTTDLSATGSIPSGQNPNAVAVSADGNFVATSAVNGEKKISVWNVQGGLPAKHVRDYTFAGAADTRCLAFSSSGRLYAVEAVSADTAVLHVYDEATKIPTSVSLSTPKAVKYNGSVTGTGQLTPAPETATQATLTRRDRNGDHALGPVTIGTDGTFSFTDKPGLTGPVGYVVGYAGDDTHTAAGAKAITFVRPLPFDVNADGYAETVVGAYAEDAGSIRDAGGFTVFKGGSSGVQASGSKWYDQNTAGVPGSPETGDMLGFSNTSGDFNGDGYADVVVSAGAENIGSAPDGGLVHVFYGSASGLRTDNVTTIGVNDTVLGAGASYVYFGDALAAGDFNGDGRDDLAIGASGASWVFVAPGSDAGLSPTGLQGYHQGHNGVPGTFHSDELFGYALAAGDINGDGLDDLAVGSPYDYDDKGWSTGSVTILRGTGSGLDGWQRWSKETPNVPGGAGSFTSSEHSDEFGHQVALSDFTGDGKADLAVAAPGSPVTGLDGARKADAGTVTVLYSDGAEIGTAGARQVSQKDPGMPSDPGSKDYLGSTMAAGDANGDGMAELAIYSYGDTYVTVVPGAAAGLAFGSAKGWTQNSPGIPSTTETGDRWGNSLRFGYVKGSVRAALIVGADGENSGQGAFTVIYSTSTGLTGTGSQVFTQDTTGVPGTAENGDGFGSFF